MNERKQKAGPSEPNAAPRLAERSPSMHEDVELWCDCCSCEAEPRWQGIEEELEARKERMPKSVTGSGG